MNNNINVLITGIGGQGIIMASDILAEAAMLQGLDVKKTDAIGMAQRGGSVISHLRFGQSVSSPLIPLGEADIILGMEKLEAFRFGNFLKTAGTVLVNDYGVPPMSLVEGSGDYPDNAALTACIAHITPKVYFVDGIRNAKSLGNLRTLNVFLLGAISGFLPLGEESWKGALKNKLPSRVLEINLQAFKIGQEEVADAGFR